jgi:hypothetical protein
VGREDELCYEGRRGHAFSGAEALDSSPVKKPAAWLLRARSAIRGLVEVATPRSWPRIIFSSWRALVLLIGILLVLVGASSPGVSSRI